MLWLQEALFFPSKRILAPLLTLGLTPVLASAQRLAIDSAKSSVTPLPVRMGMNGPQSEPTSRPSIPARKAADDRLSFDQMMV